MRCAGWTYGRDPLNPATWDFDEMCVGGALRACV
jgi:hypothetical protein